MLKIAYQAIDYCDKPLFAPELIEGDIFKTVIPLRPSQVVVAEPLTNWEDVRNKFGIKFGISSEKTLELVFQNNHLSAVDIAERLNISPRAVERHLANLKGMGVIDRVGSKKTGQWKILLDGE